MLKLCVIPTNQGLYWVTVAQSAGVLYWERGFESQLQIK